MEFKDFKNNPQELVGKYVLYESGKSYSEQRIRSIVQIGKVTKTGFRLNAISMQDMLFSLADGWQKGLNSKMDMGTISRCTLLTDEEAENTINQWRIKKEEKALRDRMKTKLESMTFEQLQKMELL
jgi:hypothetical protein